MDRIVVKFLPNAGLLPIIGVNCSGKTSLLNLMSRVLNDMFNLAPELNDSHKIVEENVPITAELEIKLTEQAKQEILSLNENADIPIKIISYTYGIKSHVL